MAWTSEVITGNKIANFDPHSPQLNYFNTQEDRKVVVGEKALCLHDTIPFSRRVWQVVKSRTNIPLEKGTYTLSAMVRTEGALTSATMYVGTTDENSSQMKIHTHEKSINLTPTNGEWVRVEIPSFTVQSDSIEVGFRAEGEADARLLVDDVEMKIK